MGNKNDNILSYQNAEITSQDLNSKKSDNNSQFSKIDNSIKTDGSRCVMSYQSFREKEPACKIRKRKNQKVYIKKIIKIQQYIRKGLAMKKFYKHVEVLRTIIQLDFSVNVIKDKKLENKLLMNNPGEVFSRQLLSQKKIKNYTSTKYYKENINKFKPGKFLIKTPLTYIDKYKNTNLYAGTWTLEKNFHGYGIFYIMGNKYEGFWNFGKLSGECRYFLQNKDYFIGNFKNGQANGYGKYFHNDGAVYEGYWENDQPNGKGREIFIDNSSFEGIFENGLKKYGLFNWSDGSYYDGEIFNNLFEGKGKFHWNEGREYIGEWSSGKMNGIGLMIYADGSKYEGHFSGGKRQGYGIYYWNKDKYYKGNWNKGKQEGNGCLFDNGKVISGLWKGGSLVSHINSETNLSKESSILSNIKNSPNIKNNLNKNKKYRSKNESKSNSKIFSYKTSKSELIDSLNLSTNQSNASFLEKYHMNKNQKKAVKNRNTKLIKANLSVNIFEISKSERQKLASRQKYKLKNGKPADSVSNTSLSSKISKITSTEELFSKISPSRRGKKNIKKGSKYMFMPNYTIRKVKKKEKTKDSDEK